jgi:acetoacetate decarboxylase
MKEADVRARAYAMPLTNPAYPPGPYRFTDREFLIITYRTDAGKLRAVVPEPLEGLPMITCKRRRPPLKSAEVVGLIANPKVALW